MMIASSARNGTATTGLPNKGWPGINLESRASIEANAVPTVNEYVNFSACATIAMVRASFTGTPSAARAAVIEAS